MKKFSVTYIYKTHKMYQIQTHTKFNETECCIRSREHFLFESQMDNFSAIWGVRWDAQTLLLVLLELNSTFPPDFHLLLGWQRWIPSRNCQRWMGIWRINSRSTNTVDINCRTFPTEFNKLVSPRVGILCSNTREYFSHFKCSFLAGSYGNSRQVIVQKFLSLGQQQRPNCQWNFPGADCMVFI